MLNSSLAAVVPWTYFAMALGGASESLTTNGSIITKVYFPRPLSDNDCPSTLPELSNVTPGILELDRENFGLGYPVAVIRKTLSWPIVNVVVATLVITGASFTMMVKFSPAKPNAFRAVSSAVYTPPWPGWTVPTNTAVAGLNTRPGGSLPMMLKAGNG